MTDPFSEYVTLLGDVGEIAVAARDSPSLSSEQRAATMARVLELVRDRVLPQSDREEAAVDALFGDREAGLAPAHRVAGETSDHEAITAPVDALAHVDPHDGERVQKVLFRLHAAIMGHFGDAEVILASTVTESPPGAHPRSIEASAGSLSDTDACEEIGPSRWFG